MLNGFKELTGSCREEYKAGEEKTKGILASALCFESLLAWKDVCRAEYRILDGYVCVYIHDRIKEEHYFNMPLGTYGNESLRRLVGKLFELVGQSVKTLEFREVTGEQLVYFQRLEQAGYRIRSNLNRDETDYIYEMDVLKERLNTQKARYNYNYFIRTTEQKCRPVIDVAPEVCDEVVERAYCRYHNCSECVEGCLKGRAGLLAGSGMPGVKGVVVWAGEKPVGYAVGTLQKDVMVFLFKKNCREYRGLDEYLHRKLLGQFGEDVHSVNYTNDLGLPGLRRYKTNLASYQLLERYRVKVERQG